MAIMGTFGLVAAFLSAVASMVLLASAFFGSVGTNPTGARRKAAGVVCLYVTFAALTLSCGVLAAAFFTGDRSLEYVLMNISSNEGSPAWLYRLAGLWAGRQGSLLFWTWLIGAFGTAAAIRSRNGRTSLDASALAVIQLVVATFVSILLFSGDNMPFVPTDPSLLEALATAGAMPAGWGMNPLLEHWAMAVHPPALFVGYAGATVPFAYALASLAVNDTAGAWIGRSLPFAVFAWVFAGIGIGLGSVWAYVVLGWGGYWGWDPVENAGLVPWLTGSALIHSMMVCRKRGTFKLWAVICATATFVAVILATIITRSGLVQSVHAFAGDDVSSTVFLWLIVSAAAATAVGVYVRRRSFRAPDGESDDFESAVSREAAFHLNNLMLLVFAALLVYMTVSSALPSWMPFGGMTLSALTYDAVARPLGIAYALLTALCPLLGWRRTDAGRFLKKARVPAVCALVAFALLAWLFFTRLLPVYEGTMAQGGSAAERLAAQGPALYYNALALVGFAVAALLVFNGAYMAVSKVAKSKGGAVGGGICHAAVGVILVGLIGSSMYATQTTAVLSDGEGGARQIAVGDYALTLAGFEEKTEDAGLIEELRVDVRDSEAADSQMLTPSILTASSGMQRLNAAVSGTAFEDLFVVYRGQDADGGYIVDIHVNPLIACVWIGFALLTIGGLVTLFNRHPRVAPRCGVEGGGC